MDGASSIPARERARVELRESEYLVRLLIQCFDSSATGRNLGDETLQPEKITAQLIERQRALGSIVTELVEHQELNDMIQQLQMQLQNEEANLAKLGGKLREAELILQGPDDEYAERVLAMEQAKTLQVKDIVEYAGRIGASYSAPANWNPSEPLGNHLPPAPTEEMMRAGQLAMMSADQETGNR